MSPPTEGQNGHETSSLRARLRHWLSALVIVALSGLILVTGAVVIWMVLTTLGAVLRTVF